MSEMVEFIIDLKDHFVPIFNESDTAIVNKSTNQMDEMFLVYNKEKGLYISENENCVVIGRVEGSIWAGEMVDIVERESS